PITAKNVKIDKILPSVISSPEFNFKGTDKRTEYLKWFEIEVEFEVDGVEMVDELTIQYLAEINGKLLPGEVTHVNIPKGRNHFSVMYISPRSLDRVTGGKQLNPGMIGNIWIKIEKQGQVLSEKSSQQKPPPNLPRMIGLMVPKSETPFQVLWWDRYEAVKTTPSR
ncbi:MAG: Amuc_1102 family pilus-like protein, partial [Verrucomicrobiota bacterium]